MKENQIKIFLEIKRDETAAGTRWEALRVYVRGQIICFSSYKTKHTSQKAKKELESETALLEEECYQTRCPKVHQNLAQLRTQYNEFSASKAVWNLTRLKQTFYDQGEKPGKLLARAPKAVTR